MNEGVTPEEAAAELLRRRQARECLWAYIEYVSGQDCPPHMKYVCDQLDLVANGVLHRILPFDKVPEIVDREMISMPPGHGKSWMASHHFPAYLLARQRQRQLEAIDKKVQRRLRVFNIIFGTHQQDLSNSFGLKVRNLIESDEHQRLFPGMRVDPGKKAAGEWLLDDGSGGLMATSVGANVTGRRGDLMLGDDLLSGIEAAENDNERNKLWAWYNADFKTRRKNSRTPFIIIGTRWHLQDHFGRLDQDEKDGTGDKWRRIVLPALALPHANDNGKPYPPDPLGRKPGEALWPEEFPAEDLRAIQRSQGTTKRMWWSLYQGSPVVEDGGIITKSWFKHWKSPDPPKIEMLVQCWDTALTANKTSAYSAQTTWGLFKDDGITNAILMSASRYRLEYDELRKFMQRMARDYRDDDPKVLDFKPRPGRKPHTVLVEAKASGQALIRDLRKGGIDAVGWNPDKYGDKIARVRLASDVIENGRLWVPAQPPHYSQLRKWAEDFVDQCGAFPASDSRDWVDTMTMFILRMKDGGWIINTEDPNDDEFEQPKKAAGGGSRFY